MCLNPRTKYSINKYLDVFIEYTDSFLSKTLDENTIENIKLKINHSLRVYKNAENIAKSINLNSQDYFIAQLCGLFHDIGRFEQFTKYKTFKDDESLYHGKLGEDVLIQEDILSNLPDSFQAIVFNAVYNHGLIEIERKDEFSLLHSKIVRDADKIDIFRIVAKYYKTSGPRNIALEYGLEDLPHISDTVMDKFRNKKLIDKEELKTLNDYKTMQLAWIFDLNFDYTRQSIIEKKYLDSVLNSLNLPENKISELWMLLNL